ncbi:MAG TPA: DUF58 domain-containing protein [Bacteriovoracaceae bacterium]|nr:DUF58 domain-containing protein [Bacteriovoracaceae bacterium]
MNLKEIERVVGMIQSHIFKKSNAYASGVLKSHFRGSGLQFKEHQVYVPGDDVRFIDWKLSARSANIYIKTFEEERNVEIIVCLDLSHTLLYGFEGVSKLQAAIEITALLFLLAGQTHDQIRVIIWGKKVVNLPPKKGREGLTLFISILERMGILDDNGQVILRQPEDLNPQTELSKITQLKSFLARRKEVIYLGDLSLVKDHEVWAKLIDKRNMHCFRLFSPVDKNTGMPFLFKAKSPVTGQSMIADLRGIKTVEPIFRKERFKEIGVHERYLEKFIRELV